MQDTEKHDKYLLFERVYLSEPVSVGKLRHRFVEILLNESTVHEGIENDVDFFLYSVSNAILKIFKLCIWKVQTLENK